MVKFIWLLIAGVVAACHPVPAFADRHASDGHYYQHQTETRHSRAAKPRRATHVATRHSRRTGTHSPGHRTASRGGGEVTGTQPPECRGIAWCGCWLRHVLGIPDRSLNLARNWAKVGQPATVDTANVVVWSHHVGLMRDHRTSGKGVELYLQSGNDGGAVRTRWIPARSLGGVIAYRKV